mmetsp:Transcript_12369/g.19017  ORF Transcript_12369/g.19017 Transcript_12369/m.19017 type:complete len:263 (+) Transcript_12369:104-892(+)
MKSIGIIDSYITEKEQKWLAILVVLYVFLWFLLKTFVKDARGKELNLAWPMVSFIATIQFVRHGCGALFDGTMVELSATPYIRLKADHEGFAELAQITFAYEVVNTLSSIVIPQYRTVEFLGHHVLTMMIAKCSQSHGPEFYGLFYLGIASLSTLPLIIVDIFRHGPPSLAATFPLVNTVARILFAVTFFAVRTAAWPLVSIVFWYDSILNILEPPADGGTWRPYLILLLLSNTFLGALQVLWAGRIWKGLKKVIQQKKRDE